MKINNKVKRSNLQTENMIGIGIAIGGVAGTAIGINFHNIALGIALGLSIGVVCGYILDQLKTKEKERKK